MADAESEAIERWRENLSLRHSWPDYFVLAVTVPVNVAAFVALDTGALRGDALGVLRVALWGQTVVLAVAFGMLSFLVERRGDPGRAWARGWWAFTLSGAAYVLWLAGVLRVDQETLQHIRLALSSVNNGFFLYAGLLCLSANRSRMRLIAGLPAALAVMLSGLPGSPKFKGALAPFSVADTVLTAVMLLVFAAGYWRLVDQYLPHGAGSTAAERLFHRGVRAYFVVVCVGYVAVQIVLRSEGDQVSPRVAIVSAWMMLFFASTLPALGVARIVGRKLTKERERATRARIEADHALSDASLARAQLESMMRGMEHGALGTFEEALDGRPLASSLAEAKMLGYPSTEGILSKATRDYFRVKAEEGAEFRIAVMSDGMAHQVAEFRGTEGGRVIVDQTAIKTNKNPATILGVVRDVTSAWEDERLTDVLNELGLDDWSRPQQTLERFLRGLGEALNAESALLLVPDAQDAFLVTRMCWGKGFHITIEHPFPLRSVLEVVPTVAIPDHDRACPYCDSDLWQKALVPGIHRARQCLMLPMSERGGLRAVLWLRFRSPFVRDERIRPRLERFAGPAGALLGRAFAVGVENFRSSVTEFDPTALRAVLDARLTQALEHFVTRVPVRSAFLLVREPAQQGGLMRLAASTRQALELCARDDRDISAAWSRVAGANNVPLLTEHDPEGVLRVLSEFLQGDIPEASTLLAFRVGLGLQLRGVLLLLDRVESDVVLPFTIWDKSLAEHHALLSALMLAAVDLNALVLNRWRYVVHELSSPLVAAVSEAEGASKTLAQGGARTKIHLESLHEHLDNLRYLLDSMETFDGSRPLRPVVEATRLYKDVILPVRAALRPVFSRYHFSLDDVRIDPKLEALPQLRIDGALMRTVFFNLLRNAAKYGHISGQLRRPIEVSGAVKGDGSVEIVVQDHGIGIPKGWEERVWEPGNRADNAVSSGVGGYGIGLSVVRRVMTAHGGTAHVKKSCDPTAIAITFSVGSISYEMG